MDRLADPNKPPPPVDMEFLRMSFRIIKRNFLGWRIPPVELPAESVIEDTVRELYVMFLDTQRPTGA
jgi:hypothetical protein